MMAPVVDLGGKRGLVVGIANESSIAFGCARAFRMAGAELAITYLNAKAEPYVRPLAEALEASIVLPCDVRVSGQLETVFEKIANKWGQLDFLFHSIAFAPREDLHTGLVNCSAEGFAMAMDVSCHSFIRMAKLAVPLMEQGGSLQTVTFYGADRVVENYNVMGPVKAALEATVRTLATDLARSGIHVHSLSAGPVKTRAASGIDRFDEMLDHARERTPAHQLVSVEEIGRVAAFLASEAAAPLTGSVSYADRGFHVVA
jgi:enoyl-[acyl-carrier protein] reductase I